MTPVYTDGTDVAAGDRIRYRQAAGGILPRTGQWRTGIAVPRETRTEPWTGSLVMLATDGRQYNLLGHEIERDS